MADRSPKQGNLKATVAGPQAEVAHLHEQVVGILESAGDVRRHAPERAGAVDDAPRDLNDLEARVEEMQDTRTPSPPPASPD